MKPANTRETLENMSEPSFVGDLWHFLKSNKKWWLLPIFVCFLILAVLAVLSSSAAAPFIYTLF